MYLAIILYLSYFTPTSPTRPIKSWQIGRLAQLVERTLSMREVEGSKPSMSNNFFVVIRVEFHISISFYKPYQENVC